MNNRIGFALGGLLLVASPVLHADDGWTLELAGYLWGAGMDGEASVEGVPVHVDMSFGDILDNLEIGFMGASRASKGRFSVGGDIVYMALGVHGKGDRGFVDGDLDIDQIGVTLDATYGITEDFHLLAGVRYNEVQAEVDLSDPIDEHRQGDEQWVDPLIGVMYRIPFSDQWSAMLRGEVGGFGVGSDFAGLLQATVRWQMNDHIGLVAGYRYFDMRFEDDDFTYDIVTSGPALGLITTF